MKTAPTNRAASEEGCPNVANNYSDYYMLGGESALACAPGSDGINCVKPNKAFGSKYRIKNAGPGYDGLYMLQNLKRNDDLSPNFKWCRYVNGKLTCDLDDFTDARNRNSAKFDFNYIGEYMPGDNETCDDDGNCTPDETYGIFEEGWNKLFDGTTDAEAQEQEKQKLRSRGVPILGEDVHLYKYNIKHGGAIYCGEFDGVQAQIAQALGNPYDNTISCTSATPEDMKNIFHLIYYESDDGSNYDWSAPCDDGFVKVGEDCLEACANGFKKLEDESCSTTECQSDVEWVLNAVDGCIGGILQNINQDNGDQGVYMKNDGKYCDGFSDVISCNATPDDATEAQVS